MKQKGGRFNHSLRLVRALARLVVPLGLITSALQPSSAGAAGHSVSAPYLSVLEGDVLQELNLARTRPERYASFLEQRRHHYVGHRFQRLGEVTLMTKEGIAALDEAVEFLRRVDAAPTLLPSLGLSQAAEDHVRDQGPRGTIGHTGKDGGGVSDRVSRYGRWRGRIGENISYGLHDARDVVIQLIVDDGVPGRGHRLNLFDSQFRVVGVACGEHARFGVMCAMTFASAFDDKRGNP